MCLKEILLLAGFAFTSLYPSDDVIDELIPEKDGARVGGDIVDGLVPKKGEALASGDLVDALLPKEDDKQSIKDVVAELLVEKDDTRPPNFLKAIEEVKAFELPDTFKDFTFTDKEISEKAHFLQALQRSLDPISAWLKSDHSNFTKFFKESGFSESFIKQFCTEEYCKLLHKVFTVVDIPSADAIYDEAIAKASEKYKIADKYEKFDESFYLWLVTYIASINDINQVKGPPAWKVKYPGKISGVDLQENDPLTVVEVAVLTEQLNAQQRSRTIKDEFEAACKGAITPAEAEFTYAYDAWRGFYIKASEPISGFEECFLVGGHPLLEEILDSLALCPGFALEDSLAGVHEVCDPTGAFKSQHKKIGDDPDKSHRCIALEYLIIKGIITRDLKLPLALLVDSCF